MFYLIEVAQCPSYYRLRYKKYRQGVVQHEEYYDQTGLFKKSKVVYEIIIREEIEMNPDQITNSTSLPFENQILKWLRSEPNYNVRCIKRETYIYYSVLEQYHYTVRIFNWDTQSFGMLKIGDPFEVICTAPKYKKDISIPEHLLFIRQDCTDFDLNLSYL